MILLPSKRFYNENCYENYYGNIQCYSSGWYNWGRWVVLGAIILAALLIFFLFSCISARRRRRLGYQPYRGTAWALGRTPPGHAPPTEYNTTNQSTGYNAQPYYNNSNAPPPAYGQGQDYYGRRDDVELQPPQPAYGSKLRQEPDYTPPAGPPPGRSY